MIGRTVSRYRIQSYLGTGVRNGRLVLPVASPDSWYWYAGVLDLQTGRLEKIGVFTPVKQPGAAV